MNPKHTEKNESRHIGDAKKGIPDHDVYAHAPYNFVPLPEEVVKVVSEEELAQKFEEEQRLLLEARLPSHDHYQGNTGYIECELVTQSPLYVRGMMTQATFEEVGDKSFDKLNPTQQQERAKFFMIRDGEPVIPGSSLRGMIRALVEIVGYGKVQPVNDTERFFYRAVAAPKEDPLGIMYKNQMGKVQAGYLVRQQGRWYVQPAIKIENESFVKAKEDLIPRDLNFIRLSNQNYKPQYVLVSFTIKKTPKGRLVAGDVGEPAVHEQSGIMVCAGNMMESGDGQRSSPRKNHCLVPAPDLNASLMPISKTAIEDYLSALSEFQKSEPFDSKMGCLIEGRPVFYLHDTEEITKFGHTPNFRLPYLRKGGDRASLPIDYLPMALRNEKDIDLAEAIFGYTKSGDIPVGKQRAYAGRVFVSDARLRPNQTDVLLDGGVMLTPKILGSPKPTTFQHYLVQPDAEKKVNLKHYASETPGETVIRGHKLYWYRDNVSRQDIEIEADKREKAKKQLTGIKPVRAGVAFKFRVYFENLNGTELGAVLWVLNLPDNHYPKLGMGKPLGLGSVKIRPTLYLSNRQQRYSRLFDETVSGWQLAESAQPNIDNFTHQFETYILQNMNQTERQGATTLDQVERIKTLLKILEWPGPDKNQTKYMELDEFKERPVLPTPLNPAFRPASDGKTSHLPKTETQSYHRNQKIEARIIGTWQKGEVQVELPDGSRGILKESKKQVEQIRDKSVTLVVIDVKKGVCYLKLS